MKFHHLVLSPNSPISQRNMELPSEIIDQILSAYVMNWPLEEIRRWRINSRDAWEDFTTSSDHNALGFWHGTYYYETKFYRQGLYDITSLLDCRLVSRRWDFSMCRLLRKQMWWNLQFDNKHTFERAVECCEAEDGGPISWIRSLSLDTMDDLRTFEHINDDDYIILNSYVNQLKTAEEWSTRSDFKLHYDKSKELRLLRQVFDKLTSIERFSVVFPDARSSDDLKAQCYDMQGVSEVIATLQYGLRSSAFCHLVDLSLMVPSTWHAGQLGDALSQDAKDRLSHLRLVIVDETGPSGSVEYIRVEEGNYDGDLDTILTSGHAPSNVQVAYHNKDYQNDLWCFVASCQNLKSLAIEATHYLQLDLLDWNPTSGSRGLRNISLRRVWASVSSIRRLLSASSGSTMPAAIQRVALDDVKIYEDGGNWDEVFDHLLARCPDLQIFCVTQLSYFTGHPRYEHNNKPWENYSSVWTEYDDENNNDRKLLHMINKKMIQRAGSSRYNYPVRLHGYGFDNGRTVVRNYSRAHPSHNCNILIPVSTS
ncbi:hypothetical protein CI238_08561 [Colletotrichum incanum]|uniref:Uncharacterized protein n=1 Tax=Colletotrichum incanum TaxID=1573173 RepID=A0A167BT28_COLIC|nr:hypothetical protein CI238_08561 [Colletotrichum incanum]